MTGRATPRSPTCRVVICDDQDGFRKVLSLMLRLEDGVDVVGEATNGREAIAVVRELQPDVLLLDIAMPVMDGLDALPHLREASPATAIVMLTGLISASVRERALAGGARLFVEKGTDVSVIARLVRDACS